MRWFWVARIRRLGLRLARARVYRPRCVSRRTPVGAIRWTVLLSNAVKYTNKGKILLGCRRRGDKLRIEVWDTFDDWL